VEPQQLTVADRDVIAVEVLVLSVVGQVSTEPTSSAAARSPSVIRLVISRWNRWAGSSPSPNSRSKFAMNAALSTVGRARRMLCPVGQNVIHRREIAVVERVHECPDHGSG
jgi:hypothetical protein